MSSYPSWRQTLLTEQETGAETGEMPLTEIEEGKIILRFPQSHSLFIENWYPLQIQWRIFQLEKYATILSYSYKVEYHA
jgi:hypothetical protein